MSVVATMLATAVTAQAGLPILYAPVRTIRDQGIALRSWGSGTVSETDEAAFEGTNSIRVSTRNFFQGAILVFQRPVSVSAAFGDKNNLLRVVMRVADGSTVMGPGSGPIFGPGGLSGQGGRPGGGAGGGNRGAGPGGFGGPGGPPGGFGGPGGGPPGGFGAPGGAPGGFGTAQNTPLRNLRVIVTTTDGKKSEAYLPISTNASGERGWRTVAVPLQAISGLEATNKEIQSVAISGDATTTFYVGDLRVVNDSTPIGGEPNVRTLNLALGDQVLLSANGRGGASILRYTWDFDASDGIQTDAEGQAILRRFRKPGKSTVTLTISDLYGLKKPYSTTIEVTVNP